MVIKFSLCDVVGVCISLFFVSVLLFSNFSLSFCSLQLPSIYNLFFYSSHFSDECVYLSNGAFNWFMRGNQISCYMCVFSFRLFSLSSVIFNQYVLFFEPNLIYILFTFLWRSDACILWEKFFFSDEWVHYHRHNVPNSTISYKKNFVFFTTTFALLHGFVFYVVTKLKHIHHSNVGMCKQQHPK